jgi:hypothetical protein
MSSPHGNQPGDFSDRGVMIADEAMVITISREATVSGRDLDVVTVLGCGGIPRIPARLH